MNERYIQDQLIQEMISYYRGDARRIQHFLKVYTFAGIIARGEKLPQRQADILATAAITHDIGIKVCEEKYDNCSRKKQELEGPAVAKEMLIRLGYEEEIIERVCYLIAHHHTYHHIQEMDHQILVEADFLVNLWEDEVPKRNIQSTCEKIFRTETGKGLCREMFGL